MLIKTIREILINMVDTNYSSTEDMINKIQELKEKTKKSFIKIQVITMIL